VRLRIDASDMRRIETMFQVAPQIVAKHMRDVFGQFAGSHRKLIVTGLTPSYQRLVRKSLFYRVRPKQTGKVALAGLGRDFGLKDIRMRIWATSPVTLLHETGGVVQAKGKRMAIPVAGSEGNVRGRRIRGATRKREGSPAALAASGIRFVRKGNLLFRVNERAGGKQRLKLTHFLTTQVQLRPALGILRSWNALTQDRRRRLDISIAAAANEMGRQAGRKLTGVLRAVS
jgi:hypothetical protein